MQAQAKTQEAFMIEFINHDSFQTNNINAKALTNPDLLTFDLPIIRDQKRNELSEYIMFNDTQSMILHADVSDLDLPGINQPKTAALLNYQELGMTSDITAICSALFSAQSMLFVNDEAVEQPQLKAQIIQRLQQSFNPCATRVQPLNQYFKQVKLSSFNGANELQSEYIANRKTQLIWIGYDVLITDENNEQTLVQADEAYEWDLKLGVNAVEQQMSQVASQVPEMNALFAHLADFSTWETKADLDMVQHEFVKRYGHLNAQQLTLLANFFVTSSAAIEASLQSSIEPQSATLLLQEAFNPVFAKSTKLNQFLQTMQTTPENLATLASMCHQWFKLITQKIFEHRLDLLAFEAIE